MRVAIIDYGSGNLRSATKAFERAAHEAGLNAEIELTNDAERVRTADRIVLPGVGAYADCRAGLDAVQQNQVVARFTRDRNEAYAEFLERCEGFGQEITRESAAGKFTYAELEENDLDLKKLKKWLAKIRNLDFFQASLGPDAETALSRCTKILDDFAEKVFLAADESRAIEDD